MRIADYIFLGWIVGFTGGYSLAVWLALDAYAHVWQVPRRKAWKEFWKGLTHGGRSDG